MYPYTVEEAGMDGSKGNYHVSDEQGNEYSIQVSGRRCRFSVFNDDIK